MPCLAMLLNADSINLHQTHGLQWPCREGLLMQDSVALERTAGNALQLMAEVVYSPSFLDFRPSLVAAGVLTSSRKAAGVWPFWPSSLAQLTGQLPA